MFISVTSAEQEAGDVRMLFETSVEALLKSLQMYMMVNSSWSGERSFSENRMRYQFKLQVTCVKMPHS